MDKKLLMSVWVLAVVMVAGIGLSGCKGKVSEKEPGGAVTEKQTGETGKKETITPKVEKTYQIGQAFTAGGNLQFKVEKVEKKDRIEYKHCSTAMGEECNDFVPGKGTYLIIYLTFKGNAENEFAGYDVDAVQLIDSKGNQYKNIEPHGAIDEWRMQSGVNNFSFAMINDPEEKKFMEIYDIPKDAQGLKLQWRTWKDKKIVIEAEVDLGI